MIGDFIRRSSRSQYGLEGFFATTLCLIAGFGFFAVHHINALVEEDQVRPAILALLMFSFAIIQIYIAVYRIK